MDMFKFRLQTLLDLRVKKEELAKLSFMEAMNSKIDVEERLAILNNNYSKYKGINTKESAVEHRIRFNYLSSLTIVINNTEVELQNNLNNLENKREILKNTQIEKKTVEKLKENSLNAFIKGQNQIEQRNNDEFALYSFIKSTRERRVTNGI